MFRRRSPDPDLAQEVRVLRARLREALDLVDEVMTDKRQALALVEHLRAEQRAVRAALEAAGRAAAEAD